MESAANIKPVKEEHMLQVVELLQILSDFFPERHRFAEIWAEFQSQANVHGYVVVDPVYSDKVIGYGSLILEKKIRGGVMGHVEDIVISPDYQGRGLGKELISFLTNVAESHGCYKLALQCKEENVEFYQNCGYKKDAYTMQKLL